MSFGSFGANTNTFGSTGASFGSTGNTFGSTNTSSPFGNTNTFSANANPTNTFGSNPGQNTSNTFGSFGSSPTFGQQQSTTSTFGSSGGGGLFGSTTASTGFGSTGTNTFGSSFSSTQGTNYNPNQDTEVPQQQCPSDGISSLEWSPVSNFLAVGSWDNSVRCYQVNGGAMQPISTELKAQIQHQKPVLDVSFKGDGSGCFSGGCDNVVKWWQFSANPGMQQAQDVGRHDAPIKCVHWIQELNLLATASWDKTLRFWDLRQPNPVVSVNLPERANAMDVLHPVTVICTAGSSTDRQILIFDLTTFPQNPSPTRVLRDSNAPLKKQYRCVSIFPDKTGFACGSIEGRVCIQYIDPSQAANSFAFKCHRDKDNKLIYPVNAISFHPKYYTFSTAGSDGKWNFWDKDSKQRLKASDAILQNNKPISITSTGFNYTGEMFAYAVSYDWSLGAEAYNPQQSRNYILIHKTTDMDIKPRSGSRTRR